VALMPPHMLERFLAGLMLAGAFTIASIALWLLLDAFEHREGDV
jgi:hypothetical protein